MFIQTQETPNPETLKFIPGIELLKKGTQEFKNKKEASSSRLPKELFDSGNITNVFIGQDFVTVTKNPEVTWEGLKPNILSIMLDFFSSGEKVSSKISQKKVKEEKIKYSKKEQTIVKKITELLEEKIKPAVAQDGGDISFVKFKTGIVFLELQGACSGCPSSTITLKSGIENMLKYYIPEVKSVEAINS